MITPHDFGEADGRRITRFRLTNGAGAYADILDLGCTVRSLAVPDRAGVPFDTVLGYDTAQEYVCRKTYMGAVCARFANRIAGACFTLNNTRYKLFKNDGENCLHGGGTASFARWDAEIAGDALRFTRVSPEGECGFPGVFTSSVTYRLTEANALTISYEARCTEDTPASLTSHCYFRLDGERDVSKTLLTLAADAYLETDGALIPTGKRIDVRGTEFDFTRPRAIGEDVPYDHCFLLRGEGMRECARATSPVSGISLTVLTDRPAVQFYTANFLSEPPGKAGEAHTRRAGFCLETEACPDAMHHADFPSCILRAGEVFASETQYIFN